MLTLRTCFWGKFKTLYETQTIQIPSVDGFRSNLVHKFAVGEAQNGKLGDSFKNNFNQLLADF